MNIEKIVEKALTADLIRNARKDPKIAKQLFDECLADLERLSKEKNPDIRFTDMLANLLLNILPEEAAERIRDESNRIMVGAILDRLKPIGSQPESFFKQEEKPCDCPACQAKRVTLAN